jgi:threonine/homoserine efflux transporter RhtA
VNRFAVVMRVGATYAVGFLLAVVIPLGLKQLLSHSVGPASIFAVTVIVAPVVFFMLGALHGTKILVLHLMGLALAILITAAQYPYRAPMNPLRQIPALWMDKVFLLYFLGALAAMFLASRPNPRTSGGRRP